MTYEYVCTACQHAWEEEQRISAAPLTTCPECHLETAKRQVSGGAGFILKGSGWYADLYSSAKPGKKEDGSGETKKADTSESKKDSGGESKKDSGGETKKTTETASSSTPASTSSSDSSSSSSTGSKTAATAT